ncbi:ATP-dependent DNA helicase Q1 [Plasmodium gonderi]|uniref:DNA 3'-5' helicase n=1 Tax=Plasmodium gonderi TaxID=77519 RepID=A0A1Y1JCL0_PLAGO|nr:ATP-dependent DNA helicase Q1 [Plasmodium gonderi]GAW80249.1 ATP-dependent DNA helicase Q1 [Plasmodium gonderi]
MNGDGPPDLLSRYKSKYRNIDIDKGTEILKEHFGIPKFKEKQVECLNAIKNFEHVLNIMPTGGGKSLIYQVTPLIIGGISIVISPLISLMYDQTKSLRRRNIVAETINSSLNKKENEKVLNLLKNYNNCIIQVLYITPETATSEYFMVVLKELYINLQISLISIDEVHCISTWGCDFRKSYRNLNKILKACPYVRVYTCTATATKFVEKDIIVNLNLNWLKKENIGEEINKSKNKEIDQDEKEEEGEEEESLNSLRIVRTSFNRPNLKYVIVYSDLLKTEKKKSIFHIIQEKRNMNKIGIIYCFKRNTCDEISKYLREQGFQALSYHAGLTNSARKKIQEKWVNGNANILVATIAFGMGIDRKDVSFIIHFNLPKSIENYYQESGRSGRNGNVSFCYLYYSKEDVEKMSYIIRSSYANLDMQDLNIQKKYEKEIYNLECVHNLCVQEKCVRSQILEHFGEFTTSKSGSSSDPNEDDDYCCSYCFDVKESRNKIEQVIKMYEEANWKVHSNFKRKDNNEINAFASIVKEQEHKQIKESNSDSDKEEGLCQYKLTNKKIKEFVPFQSASSIISKEIRDKGVIEVMKELERREELLENKLEQQTPKIGKIKRSISHSVSIKKKHVFSSFKVPRKL